jgi:hypothetical protein
MVLEVLYQKDSTNMNKEYISIKLNEYSRDLIDNHFLAYMNRMKDYTINTIHIIIIEAQVHISYVK